MMIGSVGRHQRFVICHLGDFGDGFFQALARETGSPPTIGASSEPRLECPLVPPVSHELGGYRTPTPHTLSQMFASVVRSQERMKSPNCGS